MCTNNDTENKADQDRADEVFWRLSGATATEMLHEYWMKPRSKSNEDIYVGRKVFEKYECELMTLTRFHPDAMKGFFLVFKGCRVILDPSKKPWEIGNGP